MSTEKPSPETTEKAKKPSPKPEGEQLPIEKTDETSQEKEIGGYKDAGLLEPTRYKDWEVKGRCSDF